MHPVYVSFLLYGVKVMWRKYTMYPMYTSSLSHGGGGPPQCEEEEIYIGYIDSMWRKYTMYTMYISSLSHGGGGPPQCEEEEIYIGYIVYFLQII